RLVAGDVGAAGRQDAPGVRVALGGGQGGDDVAQDLVRRVEAERGRVADVQLEDAVALGLEAGGLGQGRAPDLVDDVLQLARLPQRAGRTGLSKRHRAIVPHGPSRSHIRSAAKWTGQVSAAAASRAFGAGRQAAASSSAAPPPPASTAIRSPVVPTRSPRMSSTSSSAHSPGPSTASASPTMVRVMTYSHPSPGRKMKNPLPRWLVTQATSMTPTTAAPPSGVSSPRASEMPAATSDRLASQAWTTPGRMPRLSNHRAVPAIFPPP